MSAFDAALKFTLREEGGYVDDPADHGGATNRGITQGTYDRWRDGLQQPRQDVRLISDGEVQGIYEGLYWSPGHCADLSPALAVCHFDWCVNHGVAGALRTLQETLGVTADGVFGPKTAAAVRAQDRGGLWTDYDRRRRDWYEARVKAAPDQARFLKGWLARVDRLDKYARGLT